MIICRKWNLKMATIYTAHTTTLGRKLVTETPNFYEQLPHFSPMEEAEKRGILHVHCIEKAAADYAHVFTTISRVTSQEVRWLLQRKVDLILPNGVRLEQKAFFGKDTPVILENCSFQELEKFLQEVKSKINPEGYPGISHLQK